MENNEIKETKRGTRKPRAKRATAAAGDENAIFIGTLIQQELKNQERTVSWLARKLDCDRTNVYNIFRRQDIDTELLMRISVILHRDFFAIFSKATRIPPMTCSISIETDYIISIRTNKKAPEKFRGLGIKKSDRRGSNPRSPPWQGGALPTKLLSHVCFARHVLIY